MSKGKLPVKSDFGVLCDSYRAKRQMTIEDMAIALKKQGYNVSKTDNPSSHQSLISQYERTIGRSAKGRARHIDPPLEYVEAVSKLFNLSSNEKLELFVAALDASERISFESTAFAKELKRFSMQTIAVLLLGSDYLPFLENGNQRTPSKENYVFIENLKKLQQSMGSEPIKVKLFYNPDSGKDYPAPTAGEPDNIPS